MAWVPGIVVTGHGVASGRAPDSPYPAGTVLMQGPHFLQAGIDLSPYFPGTLNVDLAPYQPNEPQGHRVLFDGVLNWHADISERFILAQVDCRVAGCELAGLWYYPHPASKPAHFQRDTVIELLLPHVAGVQGGDAVAVLF